MQIVTENRAGWEPLKIRGRLIEAGNYSYTDIARMCSTDPEDPQISRQHVERVINRKISTKGMNTYIIMKQIATVLEKDFEEVWGVEDRFKYFGNKIKRGKKRK